jgi:hypothetical protein
MYVAPKQPQAQYLLRRNMLKNKILTPLNH